MEARALHQLDDHGSFEETHEDRGPEPLGLAPEPVEIRRNGGLAALLGVVASAVGIAYLARATGSGAWLDWLLFAVMGGIGVTYLLAFVDARTPLLVADTQGVRIRLGRTWRGMPWGALSRVEHLPRRGPLRDGRLVLVARNPERVLDELDRSGRRQSRIAERLYGAPFAVPLALSTRVTGAGEDLTGALLRLAGDPSAVVEIIPREQPGQVEDEDALDQPVPVSEPPARGRRRGRGRRDACRPPLAGPAPGAGARHRPGGVPAAASWGRGAERGRRAGRGGARGCDPGAHRAPGDRRERDPEPAARPGRRGARGVPQRPDPRARRRRP